MEAEALGAWANFSVLQPYYYGQKPRILSESGLKLLRRLEADCSAKMLGDPRFQGNVLPVQFLQLRCR